LKARREGQITGQRMLMPHIVELSPRQEVIFGQIGEELSANGFEVSQMGPRSVAIQATPAGISAVDAEKLLLEILDGVERGKSGDIDGLVAVTHRGDNFVPRGNQNKYAAGPDENGMAAGGTGQNGGADELSARTTRGAALFRARN